jgi:hypothetical protein
MSQSRLALAAATLILAAFPARAEAPAKQPLQVTNAAARDVECALVVDGRTRTFLKIHPGKTWSDTFDPRRTLQLVCEHARRNVFRVKAGSEYRLIDGDGRVDIAEGAGA